MANKRPITGESLCEFIIPQINKFASGVLHPEYVAHLERARNQPKVGVLQEYKKGKFSVFSVQFMASKKTVAERAHKYKTYTEELVNYMTKLALAAEAFLVDLHKTQNISIDYNEWIKNHVSCSLRTKLAVPLKRTPPKRKAKREDTPAKEKDKGKKTTPSSLVKVALDSIKTKKGKKGKKKN